MTRAKVKVKAENWFQKILTYKWVYLKRILRAFVSQIPTILAILEGSVPPEMLPLFVAFGAFLIALDKYMREQGYYTVVPFY